jgi:hypothetical protein
MDESRWQDQQSAEQWDIWLKFARTLSKAKKVNTSLGAEDYAAQAIEILLQQEKKPVNVEGWLALTIKRQYIHRFRKIQARGGASMRELSDEDWEKEMISHAVGSPSLLWKCCRHCRIQLRSFFSYTYPSSNVLRIAY